MTRKFENELFDPEWSPNLPQLQQPDSVQDAAVPHVFNVGVEVRFQTFLLRRVLVNEAIAFAFVDVPARDDINMEILSESRGVPTPQSQGGSFRLHVVLLCKRSLNTPVNLL